MNRTDRFTTEHASPDDSPGFLLWQVTNRWQAAQRVTLEPFELTHVQFVLLASLTWLDLDEAATHRPVTQRRLADQAATDPMMTSQVLRGLERRGLVQRAPHPADKRARALTVTPAGSALANLAVVAVEACDNAFFAILGKDKLAFTRALRSLRRNARSQAQCSIGSRRS